MTEPTYVIITIPQIGEVKIKSATEYGKVNHFLGYIEACREHGNFYGFVDSAKQMEYAILKKARDMGILEE
jgi:hypothetical protein